MKKSFLPIACVLASLFSSCMQGGDATIILPEWRSGSEMFLNADIVFIDEPVPKGTVAVIKSVQYIVNPLGSGTLFVVSTLELSEIYLQIHGIHGYYVRQVSSKDISNSGSGSYVYAIDLDFSPGVSTAQQQTTVSGKTIDQTISLDVETVNSNTTQLICDSKSISGGEAGYIGNVQMNKKSGSFMFEYNTYTIPDKITIYEGYDTRGKAIFTYEGGTKGLVQEDVTFNESVITVEVIGLGAGTEWVFLVNCPD